MNLHDEIFKLNHYHKLNFKYFMQKKKKKRRRGTEIRKMHITREKRRKTNELRTFIMNPDHLAKRQNFNVLKINLNVHYFNTRLKF